jgi:DNA-binding PadR family transcriptional regulator
MTRPAVPAAPPGDFETLILLAVLRLGERANGSAVATELADRTSRRVARGAVYVTLDRLDTKGWLTSRVEDGSPERGGRPRRLYRVSLAGRRALRQGLADVAGLQAGIESLLGRL